MTTPLPEQITIIQIMLLLEAGGGKMYDAPWLEGGKKVWRNAKGQFGKAVSEVSEQIDDLTGEDEVETPEEKGLARRWATKIKSLNPRRLLSDKLLSAANAALEYAIEQNPDFADDVTDKLFGKSAQEMREEVASRYAQLHPELANAIKQNPFKEIKGDIDRILSGKDRRSDAKLLAKDIGHAIHWAGVNYDNTIDDLNNLDGPPAVQALGKAAAIAIPVSVYLSATLTPELAVGLMVGDGLASILAGAAAGQAASFATRNALDAAHVENPWLRIGADLVAGTAAAGAMTAGLKALKPGKTLESMSSANALARSDVAEAGKEVARASGRSAKKAARIKEKSQMIVADAEAYLDDFAKQYPKLAMEGRDLEDRQMLLQQSLQYAFKKRRLKHIFGRDSQEAFGKAAVALSKKHLDPLIIAKREADPRYLPGLKRAQRLWKTDPKPQLAKIKDRTPGYERFSPKVADRLEALEHRIAQEAEEEMHLIDADTGELLQRIPGNADTVQITRGDIPEGSKVIVTHNHPSGGDRINGGILSPGDIHSAVAMGAQEIRAAGREGVYSLRRKDGNPLSVEDDIELFQAVNQAFARNADDVRNVITNYLFGRPDVKAALSWSKYDPDIIKLYAEKYGPRLEKALSSIRHTGLEDVVNGRRSKYVATQYQKGGGPFRNGHPEVEKQLDKIYDDFFAEAYAKASKRTDPGNLKYRKPIRSKPTREVPKK